jgi:hypothetical protein
MYFVDITMLASDMGTKAISLHHPEAREFQPFILPSERSFDLVICDVQVLRTQELPHSLQKTESRCLSAAQLALGLQHLKSGRRLVFLMHEIEA